LINDSIDQTATVWNMLGLRQERHLEADKLNQSPFMWTKRPIRHDQSVLILHIVCEKYINLNTTSLRKLCILFHQKFYRYWLYDSYIRQDRNRSTERKLWLTLRHNVALRVVYPFTVHNWRHYLADLFCSTNHSLGIVYILSSR